MPFSADKFIGKTARANKNLHLKVSMQNRYVDFEQGENIGVIDSWVNDKFTNPKKHELKFDILLKEGGRVFVSPKDIIGGELEEQVSQEEKDAKEKKDKENETTFEKVSKLLIKIFVIGMCFFILAKVIEKKV